MRVPLVEAPVDVALVVTRISDADPAVLRYLADRGIRLDTVLTVTEQRAFAGDATVTLDGSAAAVDLGATAASAVWVTPRS